MTEKKFYQMSLEERLSLIAVKSGLTKNEIFTVVNHPLSFDKIDKMQKYGERLSVKDTTKGEVAIDLANTLRNFAQAYFENPKPTSTFDEFKNEFLKLLHSKDAIMNKHRAFWRPIVLNIAIALTGVGLFVLAGKLVQSKITTGKCSLFCTTTKRERQVNKIQKIVDKLNPSK